MKQLLIGLIKLYQHTLSPDHGWFSLKYPGGYCRYQPTCSQYAIDSLHQHGVIKGGFLSLARVARCHPWAPVGADPVLNKTAN